MTLNTSEYLHVPAPKTQYASEFGHLIRMAQIRWNVESTLRDVTGQSVFASDRFSFDNSVQLVY